MVVTFHLSNASVSDSGVYSLKTENIAGAADTTFELEVYPFELTTPAWTEPGDPSSGRKVAWSAVSIIGAFILLVL
jgi:hypothetical protein